MSSKSFLLRHHLFIFILPLVILIVTFLFRAASGPFWLYADPSYNYLFNAFQIVKGHPPTDFTHPGTPLQILIAIIIWLFNLGRPATLAVDRVLIDPEFYLQTVFLFLVIVSFLTSVILGAYVYHKTKDKLAVLLVQLMGAAFLILPSFDNGNFPVLPVVANVSPEHFFIIIMNIFNLFLIKLYFSKDRPDKLGNIVILAAICGLGLAIKLNFLFVFLSALIVIPKLQKPVFIILSAMSFAFCTLPIIGEYPQFFQWIIDMVDHSAKYGTGVQKIIDWKSFFIYIDILMCSYWFFIFSALSLCIWGSVRIFKGDQDRKVRFIWALCFCALLHFAATAKHFSLHYLVPCFGLFSPTFLLFYFYQKDKLSSFKLLTAVFILIFIAVSTCYSIPYYKKLLVLSQDIRDLKARVSTKYPECVLIPSTTGNRELFFNKEEALHRADGYTFRMESEDLLRLYPQSYYFYSEEYSSSDPNVESYGIWNFKQRVFADDIISTCPCAILIKYISNMSPYPYQVRLLDHSKYLNAFLLVNSTEKEATELFSQTFDFFDRGDYQQALVLALKSKQLNYEPGNQLDYMLSKIYADLLKSRNLNKP